MRQEANKQGLRPVDVALTSAKRGKDLEDLLELIDKYREGRDVYVVGVTNVGKSTLINRIINQTTGVKDLITTSRFPGTTLDRIEIPFGDGHFLIDTPGIIHKHQMAHYLSPKALRLAAPQKEIKPKVYQLNEGQTLFFGALAAGTLLTPPTAEEMKDFPKLVRFEFKTTEKSDLVFAGLGWVTVKANSVVAGWAPEGVAVILRRAMV